MLVAITTFLAPGGAGSKIFDCISDGKAEYTGKIINSGTSVPKDFIRSYSISAAVSISSWPVKNNNISPWGSDKWICITVINDASK